MRPTKASITSTLLLLPMLMIMSVGSMAAAAEETERGVRQGGDRLAAGPITEWTRISGCLEKSRGNSAGDSSAESASEELCAGITIEAREHSIAMQHGNAVLNCCADISVVVQRSADNVIRFREQESGELCRCVCPYDIAAGASALPDGSYRVEVVNGEDKLLCARQVQIGPQGLGVVASECAQSKQQVRPELAGAQAETVSITTVGSSIVINHQAYLNCCFELAVEVDVTPGYYRVSELDQGEACFCMCTFDFVIVIPEVPVGEHLVELVGISGEAIATANVSVQ